VGAPDLAWKLLYDDRAAAPHFGDCFEQRRIVAGRRKNPRW
jgi:hypothetical protein